MTHYKLAGYMEDLRLVWLYSRVKELESAILANEMIASRLQEMVVEEHWELLNLRDKIGQHKQKQMEVEARRRSSWRFSSRKPLGTLLSPSLPNHQLTIYEGPSSYTQRYGLHGDDQTDSRFQLFALPRQSLGLCNSRRSEPQLPLVSPTSTCIPSVEVPVTTSYVEEDYGLVYSLPSEVLPLPAPVSQSWLPLVISEVPELTMTEDESVINDVDMIDASAEVLDTEDVEMADIDPEDLEMDDAPFLALPAPTGDLDLELSTILERLELGPQDLDSSPAAPGLLPSVMPLPFGQSPKSVAPAPQPSVPSPAPKSVTPVLQPSVSSPAPMVQPSKPVTPVPQPSVPSPTPKVQAPKSVAPVSQPSVPSPASKVQLPKPPVQSSQSAASSSKAQPPKPPVQSSQSVASSSKLVPATASLRLKYQSSKPKAQVSPPPAVLAPVDPPRPVSKGKSKAQVSPSPAVLPPVDPPRPMSKGKSKAKEESSAPPPTAPAPVETAKSIDPLALSKMLSLSGGPLRSPSPEVATERKILTPKFRRPPVQDPRPEVPSPAQPPVQPPKVQSKYKPKAPQKRCALPLHPSEWPVSQSRLRNVCRTMIPRLRDIILDFPEFFGMPSTETQAWERHAEETIAGQLAFESFGPSLTQSEGTAYVLVLFFEGGDSSIVNPAHFPGLDDDIVGRIFELSHSVFSQMGFTGLPSSLDPIYGDGG